MEIATPLPHDVATLKTLLVAETAARQASKQLLHAEREGRERLEHLDVAPAQFRVLVTRRPRYAAAPARRSRRPGHRPS